MKAKMERLEVPIAAMIDVVFLLLVYFILTSTEAVDEAYVQVNLPGDGPQGITPQNKLDIYVLENHYEVMGQKLNINQMESYINNFAGVVTDISVNVKVSRDAQHSNLVYLLDRLNKAELKKFSLHTLK